MPEPPSALTATRDADGAVQLAWPDADGADTYVIERQDRYGGEWAEVEEVPATEQDEES